MLSTEEQITGNQDVTLKKEKGRGGEKAEENIDERGDLHTEISHQTCDSMVSASFLDISRKEACASRRLFQVSFSTCQRHPQRAHSACLPVREDGQTADSGAVPQVSKSWTTARGGELGEYKALVTFSPANQYITFLMFVSV